jgi:hypothetical protein
MAKARGESNTGLITTLVLFILATLGLGIYAYMLQADVTTKESEAKKALTEKSTMEKDRDWYKFQTQYLRSITGNLEAKDAEEVAVNWPKFKDKEEILKINKSFDTKGELPRKTYRDLLAEEQARYQALQKQYEATDNARKDFEKKLKDSEDARAAADAAYKAELGKVAKQNQADLSGFVKSTEDLRNELRQIDETMNKDKMRYDADMVKTRKELEKKDKDLAKMRTRLDEKEQEVALFKSQRGDAPKDWRTDWKIVGMDRSGTQPYINLGSADRVTPQLTFNVHGVGPDGRPLPQSKGSIEVVNVLRDHLSQVRITSWKDREKDPIVKGDVLFNPVWNPTLKKHVAVAGTIDLTGDGRDSTVEFIRKLEQQPIIVDAYLDLKDRPPTIKGPGISVQTDYLILGNGPTGDPREGTKEYSDAFRDRYEEMKKQARENGVEVVNLRKFLEMIGYRLPRSLAETLPAATPRSILDQAPPGSGDRKEPEKTPER